MTLRDWRGADPAVVRDCYEREHAHWDGRLGWDTSWTWAQVEQARTLRRLPGYLACDATGGVRGWTFFVADGGTLHVGGLIADAPDTTGALLDAVLTAAESARADAVACFILDRAAGLGPALAARGFSVDPFLYLARDLSLPPEGGSHLPQKGSLPPEGGSHLPREGSLPPGGGRYSHADGWLPASAGRDAVVLAEPWKDEYRIAVSALLRDAYTDRGGVHFAADGDWLRYVTGVIDQAGCGVFDAGLSRVVCSGPRVDAVAMVTRVSGATAHLAQLAVQPALRGRGLATTLVQQIIDAATRAGHGALTLLVGEQNAPARRVYEGLGFAPRARFLAARRLPPAVAEAT